MAGLIMDGSAQLKDFLSELNFD